ncbi:MAG: hypothetical protein ABIJ21_05440 [Nanoarchaeota archaeon]
MKQISLTIPEKLYDESRKYCHEFGFKNVQEFILDLMRERTIYKNLERDLQIKERMDQGIGVTKKTKDEALRFFGKRQKSSGISR